ncbi:unnamed protein product, partial [Prorocentrum cordatum]
GLKRRRSRRRRRRIIAGGRKNLQAERLAPPEQRVEHGGRPRLRGEDPGFTWPREAAQKAAEAKRGRLWFQQVIADVKVFHFSGTKMHPWLSMDKTPQEAHQEALGRPPPHGPGRQLVATAVLEWRTALEEVTKEVKGWKASERHAVQAACGRLRRWAAWERAERREAVERTDAAVPPLRRPLRRGARTLASGVGRLVALPRLRRRVHLQRRGEPDALRCAECGGDDGTSRTWRWTNGHPSFCRSCWPTAPGDPDG